jgi:hypothetical protein
MKLTIRRMEKVVHPEGNADDESKTKKKRCALDVSMKRCFKTFSAFPSRFFH